MSSEIILLMLGQANLQQIAKDDQFDHQSDVHQSKYSYVQSSKNSEHFQNPQLKQKEQSKHSYRFANNQQMSWQAIYLDHRFYLGKPDAISKLLELQRQIAIEKNNIINHAKPVKLREGSSFHSEEYPSIKCQEDGCRTEINESLLLKKQVAIESELIGAEQVCQDNIKKLKKRKYQGSKPGQKCIQTISHIKRKNNTKPQNQQQQHKRDKHRLIQQPQHCQQRARSSASKIPSQKLSQIEHSQVIHRQHEDKILLKLTENFISFQPSAEQFPKFKADAYHDRMQQKKRDSDISRDIKHSKQDEKRSATSHGNSFIASHHIIGTQKDNTKSNSLWIECYKSDHMNPQCIGSKNQVRQSLAKQCNTQKKQNDSNQMVFNQPSSSYSRCQIDNLNKRISQLQQQLHMVQDRQNQLQATQKGITYDSGLQNDLTQGKNSVNEPQDRSLLDSTRQKRSQSKDQNILIQNPHKPHLIKVLPSQINNSTIPGQKCILNDTIIQNQNQNQTLQIHPNKCFTINKTLQTNSLVIQNPNVSLGIASSVINYNTLQIQRENEQETEKNQMKKQIVYLRKTIRQLKLQKIMQQQKDSSKDFKAQPHLTKPYNEAQNRFQNSIQHLNINQSSELPRPNFLVRKSQQHHNQQSALQKQILPVTLKQSNKNNHQVLEEFVALNQKQKQPNKERYGRIVKNSPQKAIRVKHVQRNDQSVLQKRTLGNGFHNSQSMSFNEKGGDLSVSNKSKTIQESNKTNKNEEIFEEEPNIFNDTVKSMAIKKEALINYSKFEKKQCQGEKLLQSSQSSHYKATSIHNSMFSRSKQSKKLQRSEFQKGENGNEDDFISQVPNKAKTIELIRQRKNSKSKSIRIRQTPTETNLIQNGSSSKQEYSRHNKQHPKLISESIRYKHYDQDKPQQKSLQIKGIIINQLPSDEVDKPNIMASSREEANMKYRTSNVPSNISSNIPDSAFHLNKKSSQFDNMSESSNDEGKKIFQIQFSKKENTKKNQVSNTTQLQSVYKLPQIKITKLQHQKIPKPPKNQMSPKQQIELALQTFKLFGVKITKDFPEQDLRMIKYKNCILFSLDKCNEKILWHYSGKFYIGGWSNAEERCKAGEGFQYIPDKHTYRGQFLNGKRHGTGKAQYINGSIYDGQWLDGNKHGKGKFLDKENKFSYEGEWKDNKRDGFGCTRVFQQQYYVGTYSKAVKNGHGIEVYANGDKFKGQFRMGKYHGKGKYFWANGSSYDGEFQEGYRQGHGRWCSSQKDGDFYIGQYKKDRKEGFGRYTWSNGCCFEGEFSQDNKHGNGRMIYKDGKEMKGKWSHGQLYEVDGQQLLDSKFQTKSTSKTQKKPQSPPQKLVGMIIEKPSRQFEKSGLVGQIGQKFKA